VNVISFSLYGKEPKYVRGLFENLKIQEEKGIYKDWRVAVFHDDSVEQSVLDELKNRKVYLENMQHTGVLAASWRFCVADLDCDRFIVRDSDSRISRREEEAVQEWIEDDTTLHIMRDHPHHGYPMNGGMWGMKVGSDLRMNKWLKFSMRAAIKKHQGDTAGNISERTQWWMKDMDFLRDVVYKEFATPFDSTIHNSMDFMHRVPWGCESWAKDFPSPIGMKKHFVGEIFVFDEDGNQQREYQYKER
jgi:hypothetical protein